MTENRYKLMNDENNRDFFKDGLNRHQYYTDNSKDMHCIEAILNSYQNMVNKQHEEIKELKQKSNNKQKHIVNLENKIHRMRENIKRLEVLYHYRGQEGTIDLKKECWNLKQENGRLKSNLTNTLKENEKLKKELFEAKKDYLIETADISDKLYLDKEIEELRKEIFK